MKTGGFIIMFAGVIDFIQGGLGLSVFALQFLPIIGQAAAALAGAVAEVISFTFGIAFIMALVLSGLFSWSAVLGGSIAESIPLLNMFIPGWTLMAWRCVKVKNAEEKARKADETAIAAQTPQEPAPRSFDGIRAPEQALYEVAA